MNIPFLDLKSQYKSIRKDVNNAIQDVLDNTAFAGGPFVKSFEDNFASYCGSDIGIGVSSGTAALWLALKAIGVGEGDEVITVPNTFIATTEAITLTGAKPVFVDVDEQTYNMFTIEARLAITSRTKAIIPVHLFGQMVDMDPLMEYAKANKIYVIEDASQAHGAEYKGKRAGSIGHIGCFSLYPGKNLGAYGEAGVIVTNNAIIAEKIRILRDHGQAKKYYHSVEGWNARMDGIQGAVLDVKLKHLEKWNDKRREKAQLYSKHLKNVQGIVLPKISNFNKHVFHVFAIRVNNRDGLMSFLQNRGIGCGIHYPIPLHLQEAYKGLKHKLGDFPIAEATASQFVSLPIYPELSEKQIEYVADSVREFIMTKEHQKQLIA
jgi:dTDP-4-amino-4,6-dideoxygalactose transaminase